MKYVSLFSGIGGFDLGLDRCGFEPILQVEKDKFCNWVLEKYWPGCKRITDVRNIKEIIKAGKGADIVCGGDPCQCRSLAKGNRKSRHPDLSGYFLAVVGRLRPRWVVRENVSSSDVTTFAAAMELFGYGVVIVELNAKDFTAQNRRRQFVVGCLGKDPAFLERLLSPPPVNHMDDKPKNNPKETTYCITAHKYRLAEEAFCFEPELGLRVLTADERERLQGFPAGWTAGLSTYRRCIVVGNAAPPPMIEWIGRLIMEKEGKCR